MPQWSNALTLFFSLMVEAMPFLLLGVLSSSALLIFVDERRLLEAMPRHPFLGALAGGLFGFLFPVCECGNVPVARRLLVKGAPSSVAVGFLLAAPTINPIVMWATWTAFRDQPSVVFLRLGFSLFIATIIGWVFSSQVDLRPMLQPAVANAVVPPSTSLLQSGTFMLGGKGQTLSRFDTSGVAVARPAGGDLWVRIPLVVENMVQELRELGGMLVLGSAIASIVQVGVPRDVILSLGQGPVTSIIAMMILAAVVSICSTVDSFFALSFASTFTSGSLLAFLVFGPMIDVKNIGLLLSVFKGRAIVYLFVLAAQLTFLLTLVVNLYIS
ncbi:MAG: permease [Cyanobacteria bacterium P01_F01_bin.150]